MVENQPADFGAFDRGARGMRPEQDFFVGANYPRGAIEQVNDHAPASDHVEFRFNHGVSCARQCAARAHRVR